MLSQLHRKITFAGAMDNHSGMPPGLVNRGQNLCFAISSLQCLLRTPSMKDLINGWVENATLVMSPGEEDFLCSFLALQSECLSRNLQPRTQDNFFRQCRLLMPQLVNAVPARQEQQDAAEFVMSMLNILHKILNSKRSAQNKPARSSGSDEYSCEFLPCSISEVNKRLTDYVLRVAYKGWQNYERTNDSPIVHLFTGQTADIHQCTTCLKTSVRTQEYNVLPITIEWRARRSGNNGAPIMLRLYDLLSCFIEAKRMDSRDPNCENEHQTGPICNQNAHTSWLHRTMLSQMPSVVVLQLLRYRYDSSTGETRKVRDRVGIPSRNVCLPNGPGTWPQYQLYGVVLHLGNRSTQDGHYVAYAEDERTRKWYKFDDEDVKCIDDIEEELGMALVMENAYLLFYKKT
ncbi:ubiquitin carboxyl-terminal hydrolase 8-like [Haemaphysalis longicornis]